jgi:hypothetical protein
MFSTQKWRKKINQGSAFIAILFYDFPANFLLAGICLGHCLSFLHDKVGHQFLIMQGPCHTLF